MIHALAWGLLHSLWQGALVGALAEITLRALHRARPEVRYRVAGALLALQVAWFVLTVASPSRPGVVAGTITVGPTSPWPLVLVAAWVLGVLALGVRLAGGLLVVWRVRRRSIAAPPGWKVRFDELQARLGLSGVTLRLVPEGLVPMAVGFVRPAVLVPASLLVHLTPTQLEAVLLHELAHVRRLDWLVNLAQSGAELLLFHHPATWWLSARIRHERELCCDHLAVEAAGDPLAYARALADLEAHRALVTAHAVTGGDLMDRILRLLGTPRPPRRASWLWPALVAGSLLGLASAVAVARTVEPDAVASVDPDEQVEPERPTEPEDVGAKVLEMLADKLEQGAEALEEKADERHERRVEKKRKVVRHEHEHHPVVVHVPGVVHVPPPPPPPPMFDHDEVIARALAEAERARAEAHRAAERARAEAHAAAGYAYVAGAEGCRTWRGGGTTVIVCQDGAADAELPEVRVVPRVRVDAPAWDWQSPEWEAQVEAWADQAEVWSRFAEQWSEHPPIPPMPPMPPMFPPPPER